MKLNVIFYLYYFLILVLTLSDIFYLKSETFSLYFALATAFIGLILQISLSKFSTLNQEINTTLSKIPKIEMLHEEEFYSKFKSLINFSTQNIDITNLSLDNPLKTIGDEQHNYYKEFIQIIKQKKNVKCRRVERISVQKIEWIDSLINDFRNVNNFSLYCINETEESRKKELIDLLSVQRIDDQHTMIVALLEHDSTGGKRDIYIRDSGVTHFFIDYYNKKLIARSTPIIKNGKINTDSWNTLKKSLI
jgi:hypothetical protein